MRTSITTLLAVVQFFAIAPGICSESSNNFVVPQWLINTEKDQDSFRYRRVEWSQYGLKRWSVKSEFRPWIDFKFHLLPVDAYTSEPMPKLKTFANCIGGPDNVESFLRGDAATLYGYDSF